MAQTGAVRPRYEGRVVFIFPLSEVPIDELANTIDGIALSEVWPAVVVDNNGFKYKAIAYIAAPSVHTVYGYKGKPELVVMTESGRTLLAEDFSEIYWVYDPDYEYADEFADMFIENEG